MKLVTIDFETYYDQHYSLSKITTEAYIRSNQFQVIGVGVIVEDEEPMWMEESDFKAWAKTFPWHTYSVLCHHTHFDGAIMSWHYGIRPALWLDTLSMARAVIGGYSDGFSLDTLAKLFEVGTKGDYPMKCLGIRREQFTQKIWEEYGEYCINDCELTRRIFFMLARGWRGSFTASMRSRFPNSELKLIDKLIRMYTEPVCQLDHFMLGAHYADIILKKKRTLTDLGKHLGLNIDQTRKMLGSASQFAEALKQKGAHPPSKLSPTTGLNTWAFAKTDKDFINLLQHPDPLIRELVQARLDIKSSIEETRTKSMIEMSYRGPLAAYYKYSGADQTHRFSGGDGTNFQNLPRGGVIRNAICAPNHHKIFVIDSANIEARVVDTLAHETEAIQVYRDYDAGIGPDIYCYMAGKYYGREIVKGRDLDERQFGKTLKLACFSAGTKVLTHTGTKSIIDVCDTDLLWDGVEWVKHQGLIPQGVQQTVRYHGVAATPDHEILTGLGWRGWQEVHTKSSLSLSALSLAPLPLSGGVEKLGATGDQTDGMLKLNVLVGLKGWLAATLWQTVELPAVINARKLRPAQNYIGSINTQWETIPTVEGYLTGYQQQLPGVIAQIQNSTHLTAGGESMYALHGGRIVHHFLPTYKLLKGGILRFLIWIGLITIRGTNPVTLDLAQEQKTPITNEQLKGYKNNLTPHWQKLPVYDLRNSGPRHRFTIITDAGPMLVHNCGFGMGWNKFKDTTRIMADKVIDDEDAQTAVYVYRSTHRNVVGLWKKAEKILPDMQRGLDVPLDESGIITTITNGFVLPNELVVKYPELHKTNDGWVYRSGRIPEVKIYGGKAIENVVQALARIIVMEQCLALCAAFPKYPWVMTSHDEGAWIVPEKDIAEFEEQAMRIFRTSPSWWSALPVNAEAGIDVRYGWAK